MKKWKKYACMIFVVNRSKNFKYIINKEFREFIVYWSIVYRSCSKRITKRQRVYLFHGY